MCCLWSISGAKLIWLLNLLKSSRTRIPSWLAVLAIGYSRWRHRVSYLEKAMASLQERLDDQEDRGRRRIFRRHFGHTFYGVVDSPGSRTDPERAHQVSGFFRRGAEPRKPYPRVMIVRFHHYGERARVLEAATRAKSVHLRGNRIFFFQDFSSATQRKRRAFDEARKKLQSIGIRTYGINYPATLRITVNNVEEKGQCT